MAVLTLAAGVEVDDIADLTACEITDPKYLANRVRWLQKATGILVVNVSAVTGTPNTTLFLEARYKTADGYFYAPVPGATVTVNTGAVVAYAAGIDALGLVHGFRLNGDKTTLNGSNKFKCDVQLHLADESEEPPL